MDVLTRTAIYDSCLSFSRYLESFSEEHDELIRKAAAQNGWFTPEAINQALLSLSAMLKGPELRAWTESIIPAEKPLNVGLVLAGNIPLVGFNDILCTLCSGNIAQVKLAAADSVLLPLIFNYFTTLHPYFNDKFYTVERLQGFNAVIATGSNNTGRYFEHYFGKVPHIIRKNRSSAAVLGGNESEAELLALGHDILDYYGLGCRNVSRLYVPEGYDFGNFFRAIEPLSAVRNNNKYNNNYDYNKAILLVNRVKHLDNGFLLLTENEGWEPAISVVHYNHYSSVQELNAVLEAHAGQLQCVAADGIAGLNMPVVPLGATQRPGLLDYADGVDTINFLNNLPACCI